MNISGKSIKKINLRPPWRRFFSSPASPETRIYFALMVFTLLENALNLCIFTHTAVHHSKLQAEFFEYLFLPSRKGWSKLWYVLSKFNQKIWRWLGTLGYLYFIWFVIFLKCSGFTVLLIISTKQCGIKFIAAPLRSW